MNTVRQLVYILLDAVSTLIVIRCILSFVVMAFGGDFIYKLYNAFQKITDPILLPFRKLLEHIPGLNRTPVDFSPMLAIITIYILQFLL